ncbi:MAG: acetolactate synthase small subunit [Clostridia bacterium]|nr:acetolactate synthase small subunit [Deltaproteobacteria bacterium]
MISSDFNVHHTFTAYLEDKPGALARVSSLFLRRNYNIVSLTVGRSAVPGVSRLTVVVDADADSARLIEANLYKLVNVLRVEDVTYAPTVEHELILIKVRAGQRTHDLAQLCETVGARIVDDSPDAFIIEATGSHKENEQLISQLGPYGLMEIVCTGVAAMKRGGSVLEEQPQFVKAQVPSLNGVR